MKPLTVIQPLGATQVNSSPSLTFFQSLALTDPVTITHHRKEENLHSSASVTLLAYSLALLFLCTVQIVCTQNTHIKVARKERRKIQ